MIRGTVNERWEAVVPLRVRGPGGTEAAVQAVVDSGFNGSMTLPMAVVASLGLRRESRGSGLLADGSSRVFDSMPPRWPGKSNGDRRWYRP